MEATLRDISLLTGYVDQLVNEIRDLLLLTTKEAVELNKIKYRQFTAKSNRLITLREKYLELILKQKSLEKEAVDKLYDAEFKTTENLRDLITELEHRVANHKVPSKDNTSESSLAEGMIAYKYADLKIEAEFEGDPLDWLRFWGLYKKIHENSKISKDDKFHLLLQHIKPKSKAHNLITVLPPVGDNYNEAFELLKNRFGREELLVQVYIRQLLSMVMHNAMQGRVRGELSVLYDRLRTYIHALHSLECYQDRFADFLSPLVESCLPDDVLRAWQRQPTSEAVVEGITDLQRLMAFIGREVNADERIKLARSGFDYKSEEKLGMSHGKNKHDNKSDRPTSAVLVGVEQNNKKSLSPERRNTCCSFCGRAHDSQDCLTASKMSLEERKKSLIGKGACFACLRIGHRRTNCRIGNIRCVVCSGRHFPVMCNGITPKPIDKSEKTSTTTTVNATQSLASSVSYDVYLQTLLLQMYNGERKVTIRAIIDTGSQRSYISEKIANELSLPIISEEETVHTLFGGHTTEPVIHRQYRVYLCRQDGKNHYNFEVLSQHKICGDVPVVPVEVYHELIKKERVPWLTRNDLCCEIDLLIGADVAGKLLTGKVVRLREHLVAVETRLGWTIIGRSERVNDFDTQNYLSLFVQDSTISNLWKLDLMGISDPIEVRTVEETERDTTREFQKSLTRTVDGRYRVRLPWRYVPFNFSDNYELTCKRQGNTRRKISSESLMSDYMEIFNDWELKGIIERVPDKELNKQPIHYLPHRPVVKENSSTTRIRPVFDASARMKGNFSLNDCLDSGPNLIAKIPDVLDRFRSRTIGIVADIERAFLQIEIDPIDRDYLRFLSPLDDSVVYRHCRVVFGITSSPFLLGAVIQYHLERVHGTYAETARKLQTSFYVDNCATSVDSVSELVKFRNESIKILDSAKFNLRCWETNCLAKDSTSEAETNVLGLCWNKDQDTLRCVISKNSSMSQKITKRTILSEVQRIFDPIGYLCSITVQPKKILQRLCELKLSWDEEVPEEYANAYQKWTEQQKHLTEITIPRFTGISTAKASLHVFVDACQESYAACAFVRMEDPSGKVSVNLVRAKNRVSPLKKATIPRLELLSCSIGARLAHSIRRAVEREDMTTYFWTDSMTALCWIKNGGPWKTFVYNRVQEIRKLSNPESWFHVPGNMNPADLPSRGAELGRLLREKWFEGPSWLYLPKVDWPKQTRVCTECEETDRERRFNVLQVMTTSNNYDVVTLLLYFWSSYHKIVRMVAWINRYFYILKTKDCSVVGQSLTVEEIDRAEKTIFRLIQSNLKIDGFKRKDLLLDEVGVWRVRTPLWSRDDDKDFVLPILLPGNHDMVRRIIEYFHFKHCHAGPKILWGLLRQRFWITSGKRAIRTVVRSCQKCRRYDAHPLSSPTAPLPKDRVGDATVFEITGIDMAGPVYLKGGQKAWIVLFTCAVFRAIHLELVTSLSTEAFLQSLRRFISRRNRPRIIYSDNGSNFVGANNAFGELDWDHVKKETEIDRIWWKFNPPTAAWWGGFWERMVGMVKGLLRKVLGKSVLDYEQMITVLCDCEATINSRPLTYLYEDLGDMIPLTPSMFLHETSKIGVADLDEVEVTLGHLVKTVKLRRELTERLRHRFRVEYLGELKNRVHSKTCHSIKVGDIVLIADDKTRRLDWPLGRVAKVFPGIDGNIRRVLVHTQKGDIERPIQRLIPLEMQGTSSGYNTDNSDRASSDISNPDEDVTIGTASDGEVGVPRKQTEREDEDTAHVVRVTKSGRMVRTPDRLDLFNQVMYMFGNNKGSPKGGSDVRH